MKKLLIVCLLFLPVSGWAMDDSVESHTIENTPAGDLALNHNINGSDSDDDE